MRNAGTRGASISRSQRAMLLGQRSGPLARSAPRRVPPRAGWSRAARAVVLALTAGWLLLGGRPGLAQAQQRRPIGRMTVPSDTYFAAFRLYQDGQFEDALRVFEREGRGAIKTTESNWIDSIAYHTMAGECHWQMGRPADALKHYDAALQLTLAFSDWMLRVQFEPVVRPATSGQRVAVPWGQSRRGAQPGSFSDTTLISQGRLNNNEQVAQGGVVQQPVLLPCRVDEIVRTIVLALRRRQELLGPLSEHDRLSKDVLAALARRPGPANHWSEAWIDCQLGLAYAAAGKLDQARGPLERALVAGGQFDHPLTGQALVALGQIALASGDLEQALGYFDEATYVAVQYPDAALLEEAFRAGALVWWLSNRPGVYPPLESAIAWAASKRLRHLHASLLLVAAENQAILGQWSPATTLLREARGSIGNREMMRGRLGARLQYVSALAAGPQVENASVQQSLAAALDFQRRGSARLFQIALVDRWYADGTFTPRIAVDLYARLLDDPTAADWSLDPLDALAYLTAPRGRSLEAWFEAAVNRREFARAVEIADLARRHRFLSTIPLGGRPLGLAWMLSGPPSALDQRAALERQNLLTRYPQLGPLLDEARRLETELRQAPTPADVDARRRQSAALEAYATAQRELERLVAQIAIRREPATLAFPPRRSVEEIKGRLAEGTGLVDFFVTDRAVHGMYVSPGDVGFWELGTPERVRRDVAEMLRVWGNVDGSRAQKASALLDNTWQAPAARLLSMLLAGAKTDLVAECRELVIVPDGALWYVPFEALVVERDGQSRIVMDEVRVRYAPLASLAVADERSVRRSGHTGVVVGKLHPREPVGMADAALEQLTRALPGTMRIERPLPSEGAVYRTLLDRLLVLDDIPEVEKGLVAWTPLRVDRGTNGSSLADWMRWPAPGPDQVLLPGFHSAAENALRRGRPESDGDELFFPITALMASGSRTVLVSRWRTGGQASIDLLRELAQELPHASAMDAWHRSVSLLRTTPLDAQLEPRVEAGGAALTAEHPFFWAGYLLADQGAAVEPLADDPAAGVAAQ